jgi:hypothetical protein
MAPISDNIVNECTNIIIKYLFDYIGKENIVSLILTGSAARNHATYTHIDGNLSLESDLDFVVVVKSIAIIKSFIVIKRMSKKVTSDLNKRKLTLSHVSFSVTTEKALLGAGPSIFYQDLNLNGKVILGKDMHVLFRSYQPSEIPIQDLYRLVFNRMVESLEALVLIGITEKKITRESLRLFLKSIQKLNFALIQAILIRQGILIFNISEIRTINLCELKNWHALEYLIKSYEELVASITKSQENCSTDILERCWLRIIDQFNFTARWLSGINDGSIPSTFIKKELFEHESFIDKLKVSVIIFLQYFGIYNVRDVIEPIIYIMRFGSDHVYFVLYDLFVSSANLMKSVSKEIEPKQQQQQEKQQQFDSSKSNLHEVCYTKEKWLRLYKKYLRVWKLKTGG